MSDIMYDVNIMDRRFKGEQLYTAMSDMGFMPLYLIVTQASVLGEAPMQHFIYFISSKV